MKKLKKNGIQILMEKSKENAILEENRKQYEICRKM